VQRYCKPKIHSFCLSQDRKSKVLESFFRRITGVFLSRESVFHRSSFKYLIKNICISLCSCAPGYFGNPQKYGGYCQKCNCNSNGQLASCDRLTGGMWRPMNVEGSIVFSLGSRERRYLDQLK